MTSLLAVLLLTLLGIVPGAALGAPVAKIALNENRDSCPGNYPFQEDNLKIVISEENRTLAEMLICSSYGKAEAVVEKDAKDDYYLLVRHGDGRGTNVRLEYLSIYKVGRDLIEHVRIPMSQPSSPTGRWYYDYRVSKPKAGGLLVSLTLRIDGEKEARFFPADKHRAIKVR